MEKKCTKCCEIQPIENYYKHPTCKDGHIGVCKSCKIKDSKLYVENNRSKVQISRKNHFQKNKEQLKVKNNKYRSENKEKVRAKEKEYAANHVKQIKESKQKYERNNKEKIKASRKANRQNLNLYYVKRRKEDPLFKLSTNLRKRIGRVIKKTENSPRTLDMIGCSFEEARNHIEKQFKPGMTWDNYGFSGEVWHVDHIVPISSAKTEEEIIKLFHYTNLQPLWCWENLKKNNKMPHELC